VKAFIDGCEVCKRYKHNNQAPHGLMKHPKRVEAPLESLSTDLIGPFPLSHNRNMYILTVVDNFSKFLWAFPLRQATSKNIIKLFEERIFLPYGVPKSIVTDNGKQFVSKEFKSFLSSYGITDIFYNAYYHPQNNPSERYNSTILTALSILVNDDQRNWCTNLPRICSCLNSSVSLATGHSPYFLLHGKDPVLHASFYNRFNSQYDPQLSSEQLVEKRIAELNSLSHLYDKVSTSLVKAFHQNANRYNLRRKELIIHEGQTVWRRSFVQSDGARYFSAKLAPRFIKCKVVKRLSPTVYVLQDIENNSSGACGNYHVKDIIKC
jgi:hypothetical protein